MPLISADEVGKGESDLAQAAAGGIEVGVARLFAAPMPLAANAGGGFEIQRQEQRVPAGELILKSNVTGCKAAKAYA